METTRFLAGFFCLFVAGSSALPAGHLLGSSSQGGAKMHQREQIVSIAVAELGVRERANRNDGERVEEYLAAVKLERGNPWCAAFVSWVFKKGGYLQPRTGWSPALFPAQRLVKNAEPGHVFGIYFSALKRIAHCGIVCQVRNNWIIGIEGNTLETGGREGDGVYRKWRHKRSVYRYADWLTGKGGEK